MSLRGRCVSLVDDHIHFSSSLLPALVVQRVQRVEGISDANLALGCIHSTVLAAMFISFSQISGAGISST